MSLLCKLKEQPLILLATVGITAATLGFAGGMGGRKNIQFYFYPKSINYCTNESSIMKLATLLYSKIFVSLSLSKSVISFDNRLEAVRLSGQG